MLVYQRVYNVTLDHGTLHLMRSLFIEHGNHNRLKLALEVNWLRFPFVSNEFHAIRVTLHPSFLFGNIRTRWHPHPYKLVDKPHSQQIYHDTYIYIPKVSKSNI